MATEFCQRCKQSHPGRLCDYDEKGDCADPVDTEKEESTTDSGTGALLSRRAANRTAQRSDHSPTSVTPH
jgi:hypothetical protein